MIQYIYIVDEEKELYNKLNELFINEDNFSFKKVMENELEIALKNIPSLIIINEDSLHGNIIDICSKMLLAFEQSGIKVIKCGLHASEFVERDMIGGFYHPAFRELCESRIYKDAIDSELQNAGISYAVKGERLKLTVAVSPDCISKAAGHKRSNIEYYKSIGIDIKLAADESIPRYLCEIRR